MSFVLMMLVLGAAVFGPLLFVWASAGEERQQRERRTARDLDMRKPGGRP